jgi:hypothetical protein
MAPQFRFNGQMGSQDTGDLHAAALPLERKCLTKDFIEQMYGLSTTESQGFRKSLRIDPKMRITQGL